MSEFEPKLYLNPITLESQVFLKALEHNSQKHQYVDMELLNVMEKVVDAVNKFYDQCLTKVEETDSLKLVKAHELDFVLRAYTCKRCHKYLGPSAEKAARHVTDWHGPENVCQKKSEVIKKKQEQKTPNKRKSQNQPELPKLSKKARSLLTEKIDKFFKESLQTADELKQQPVYDVLENDLVSLVQPLYPKETVKMYKFGSRMCGIGSENSDLDIYLDIGNTFHTFENRASAKTLEYLVNVYAALFKDHKWSRVLAIENARVPIIRCLHNESQMSCDIGFSNSLGPCNTSLMEYFFELQPIAPCLCIYLKKWLQRTRLDDIVTTYSMTLCIVFFLQHNQLLPSVKDLQDGIKGEEIMIGPWISNFEKLSLEECSLNPKIEPTKANFRKYMADFFSFMANFDFEKFVISPYFGSPISIKDISAKLPKRYTDFVQSTSQSELQLNKLCIVQDPIQLNHNVTRNITATGKKLLIHFAKESAMLLNDNKEIEENDDLI